MKPCRQTFRQSGFTLTELAVVVVIIAIMIGGMLIPLSTQDNIRRSDQTQRTLLEARDALLGYAAANDRLPCPAWDGRNSDTNNTLGRESYEPGHSPFDGVCRHPHEGLLPAVELGLAPTDGQGFLLDGWGNRIRYAVPREAGGQYNFTMIPTATNGIRGKGMSGLTPDLHVCDRGPTTITFTCPGVTLTANAVAVLYSLGANGARGGRGTDESQNPSEVPDSDPAYVTPDRVFVSHTPTPADAANGEFDDLMIWLSPNILYNRMIAAGRLP